MSAPPPERILGRLEELFALGAPPRANRPGLSRAEQTAIDLAATWMREAGLQVSLDAAGNLLGRLPGAAPEQPEVWAGSHLDTVPAGGRFDGALGVVAAIEAVGALAASPLPPARTVAVVVFRDEEGWRFGRGLFGSRALCGRFAPEELERADAGGVTIAAALDELGLAAPPPAGANLPGTFVELHVEQGPVLADRGLKLGVVSGIVGMTGGRVRFTGRSGHAGTTPMAGRSDAACAAAAFVLAVRHAALAEPGAVATSGVLAVTPGATNVIPGAAVASYDGRAPDAGVLQRLSDRIASAAFRAAASNGCHASVDDTWQEAPVAMSRRVVETLAAAVRRRCGDVAELPSGAGHDAGVLAACGVETGMLFARSLGGGMSHSPEEETDLDAVAAAADVLTDALGQLSS